MSRRWHLRVVSVYCPVFLTSGATVLSIVSGAVGCAAFVHIMSYQDDDEATLTSSTTTTRVRYEGEDTSPTSPQELRGWYAYPVAAEVFAVVAVGTYFSLLCIPRPFVLVSMP